MNLLSFFRLTKRSRQSTICQRGKRIPTPGLRIEALEDRSLPSANSISGYVFLDANNNGLFDPGEAALANSTIQLRNAANIVIGTAVTDANGFYQFSTDSTISTAPATLTRTATIPSTSTDWTRGMTVQQFDPSLGTLLSVEIVNAGTFTSQIKVESLDGAASTIIATDAGTLTLLGPGFAALVTSNSTSKTFNASAFDGLIDFGGTSGHDFGAQSADGSNSITVSSASDLATYVGNNSVSLNEMAKANSSASGAGNLITQISTSANAQVSVIYHYIPSNALRPGTYTVVQISQPPNLLEGLESSNGAVITGSVDADSIVVALMSGASTNNDFAELQPSSLAGFVYYDSNNNGLKDAGEPGIANVKMTLTGSNDLGAVNLTAMTAGDGSYQFSNLRPGTYTLSETQPAAYLQGKNSLGSLSGTMGNDQFGAIGLQQGTAGVNYNFGEVLGANISGFVYQDVNKDGVMDTGDLPIPNTTITLTGMDDLGAVVNITQVTAPDGSYAFQGLRPGNFSVTETQPAGYDEGTNNLGSAGGTLGTDQFLNISLAPKVAGINYNFGETLTAQILVSFFTCGNFSFGHPDLSVLSKEQFLSNSTGGTSDPTLKAEATYVDGLYRGILGRPADASGLVGWVLQLHAGAAPLQVVQGIWNSAEHRSVEVDNLYSTLLHRPADAAGRAYWVNVFLTGASETDVAAAILASGEYQATHPDNSSFVTGLYADLLGRTASNADIASWARALQSGASRNGVARAFLTSAEFFAHSLECDYRTFLQRVPDAAGEQSWLALLGSGQATPQSVTESFLASAEFLALAQQASLS